MAFNQALQSINEEYKQYKSGQQSKADYMMKCNIIIFDASKAGMAESDLELLEQAV